MNKLPVSDKQFWKKRLEDSKDYGDIHHSVYISRKSLWEHIARVHRDILLMETKGKKTLDAGCGYGRASEWVEDYTGVDISPDLLAVARKSYPQKTFMEADLSALPFKDKEFDVAFCISIKQMIIGNLGGAEWEKIEKELRRAAKKVILLEYENPETPEILY